MTASEALKPEYAMYAALRARGVKQTHAAKQVGRSIQSVIVWERSPWFTPTVTEEREKFLASREHALAPLVPTALQVITDALARAEDTSDAWRIIEHFYGRPHQSTTTENHSTVNVVENLLLTIREAAVRYGTVEPGLMLNAPPTVADDGPRESE